MSDNQSRSQPALGIISDESGPSLDGCIEFCIAEGLEQIEIRMVDGIAPLSLTETQAKDANARIRAAGLTVSGIATPLLKWEMPGKNAADQGDQFGFSREGRSDDDLTEACVRLADLFETRNLRIFSYLTHEDFVLEDLKPAFDRLLEHAEKYDKVLRLENEPVCNIARFDQLADVLELFDTDRLEGIPDVGNSAQIGEFPNDALVSRVMARSSHVHFKDWGGETFVPLGTGQVKLDGYMSDLASSAVGRQLSFSLETHCHDDPLGGSRTSARELNRQMKQHWS